MQTSGWEQKAPLRPHEGGGEPASLTPPGRLTRCWAGTAPVAGGSPPPSSAASAAAPPGQPPLEARERAARTAREEDGGGANREPRREGRGRRQGLEAQAPREGLSEVGARDPAHPAPRLAHSLHTRVVEYPPARVSREEQSWSRWANPLTKESPALLVLAQPLHPRSFPTGGIRAQPKGEPRRGAPASPTASRLRLGPLWGPICWQRRTGRGGRSAAP